MDASLSQEVLDHETYILNLTAANSASTPPTWELEYTAKVRGKCVPHAF